MTFISGGTIVTLGPIVAPLLRSLTSKVVPLSERGTVSLVGGHYKPNQHLHTYLAFVYSLYRLQTAR